MAEPFERLLEIVAKVLDVPVDSLSLETEADAVESWDSLRHLAIITAVEEEYGIEMTMEAIAGIDGIRQLHVAVVEARAA